MRLALLAILLAGCAAGPMATAGLSVDSHGTIGLVVKGGYMAASQISDLNTYDVHLSDRARTKSVLYVAGLLPMPEAGFQVTFNPPGIAFTVDMAYELTYLPGPDGVGYSIRLGGQLFVGTRSRTHGVFTGGPFASLALLSVDRFSVERDGCSVLPRIAAIGPIVEGGVQFGGHGRFLELLGGAAYRSIAAGPPWQWECTDEDCDCSSIP